MHNYIPIFELYHQIVNLSTEYLNYTSRSDTFSNVGKSRLGIPIWQLFVIMVVVYCVYCVYILESIVKNNDLRIVMVMICSFQYKFYLLSFFYNICYIILSLPDWPRRLAIYCKLHLHSEAESRVGDWVSTWRVQRCSVFYGNEENNINCISMR